MNLIADDEIVLRHVPGGTLWQAPGPRVTSHNFRLRTDRGETGVSVTRKCMTSPEQLVAHVGGSNAAGSRIAEARVAGIREIGLEVVPVPLEHDPGHAEIRSESASLEDHATRKKLARLFAFA